MMTAVQGICIGFAIGLVVGAAIMWGYGDM